MHTWTKTAGLLFLAASSVYIDQVALGGGRRQSTAAAPNDAPGPPGHPGNLRALAYASPFWLDPQAPAP